MPSKLSVVLARSRVLSLDVFDTCLLRRVGHPTHVFEIVEHSLANKPGLRNLSGGPVAFRKLRIRAEQAARDRLWSTSRTSEVTYSEIYAELQNFTGLADTDIESLKRAECETERGIMVSNPEMRAMVDEALHRGLRVAYVSDMYHSEEFITELLTNAGYPVTQTDVFVSSTYRKSKGDGSLFAVVSSAMGIPLRDFVHVGDNLEADVNMPRKLGMRSYHYVKLADRVAFADTTDRQRSDAITRPDSSLALGIRDGALALNIVRDKPHSTPIDPWFQLGFERIGILFLGFTQWLIERQAQDGIDQLLFLARDGHIMKQCYDRICEWRGLPNKSLYLYASRRALVFPSILSVSTDDLDFVMSGRSQTLRQYIERCGLLPARYERERLACGFTSMDQRMETPEDWSRLRQFFFSISTDLLQAAAAESIVASQYLDQMGIIRQGNVGLVDIGWHGSMQEGFTRLARVSGRSCNIQGYYLGLHEASSKRIHNGHRMSGYLTNQGQPEDLDNWIRQCVELVEFVFLAPHGSCLGYRDHEGSIVPVLDEIDVELTNLEKAQRVQEGALAFLESVKSVVTEFPDLQYDPLGSFYPYGQVILTPTEHEAKMLGDLTHSDGFGQSTRNYLANPDTVKAGKARLDSVYWKIGYQRRMRGR